MNTSASTKGARRASNLSARSFATPRSGHHRIRPHLVGGGGHRARCHCVGDIGRRRRTSRTVVRLGSRHDPAASRRGRLTPERWWRRRGQATVEFALVAPLFLACTFALVGTAVVCTRALAQHDLARRAARAASVADDPCAAARVSLPNDHRLRCTIHDDGTVSVAVSSRITVPLVGRVVTRVLPWSEVTVMREPPPVLG